VSNESTGIHGDLQEWVDSIGEVFGETRLEAGAEADEPVDGGADGEVDERAPIGAIAAVPQAIGKVRREREEVDRVTDEDRDEIFEPSPRSHA